MLHDPCPVVATEIVDPGVVPATVSRHPLDSGHGLRPRGGAGALLAGSLFPLR